MTQKEMYARVCKRIRRPFSSDHAAADRQILDFSRNRENFKKNILVDRRPWADRAIACCCEKYLRVLDAHTF
jgi:hypothetical protein